MPYGRATWIVVGKHRTIRQRAQVEQNIARPCAENRNAAEPCPHARRTPIPECERGLLDNGSAQPRMVSVVTRRGLSTSPRLCAKAKISARTAAAILQEFPDDSV